MTKTKQFVGIFFALTMVVALVAACGSTTTANTSTTSSGSQWTTSHPFTAGFIYVGAPSDAGWTHAHDVGRLQVASYFGGRVKTLFKEDVPEGPQCSQVITELVNEGANIIFATSFGYQPELLAAATNNKIGFVAPYPIPEVIREVDAFTMGAQLTNPKATVQVVWTNTWFGPATERQAAESLVAAGVSVLADGQDSPTTGQVAEANSLKWTGYDSNQESFAPKAWLTATTYNWGPYYINEVKAAMNGTWKSQFWYGGLADGFVVMAPFGKSVSQATRTAILAKEQQIIKGTFDPFTGPIYDQSGKLVVAKGVTLSVMQKYSITWFVKGVLGNPKG